MEGGINETNCHPLINILIDPYLSKNYFHGLKVFEESILFKTD